MEEIETQQITSPTKPQVNGSVVHFSSTLYICGILIH